MNNRVENWVNEWALNTGNDIYREINAKINFFSKELYHDYQPIQGHASSFKSRLENWLLNIADESDRQTLFKILPHIFYVGGKEFNSLFRVAYNELIANWLIDSDDINFNDLENAKRQIDLGIRDCWICPITDSLNINSFFHINNIPGNGWNEWRPQWYTIDRGNNLWNTYYDYILTHGIRKLVLLEDFVGSGSQVKGVIDFILSKGIDLDVLLVPLINCPEGNRLFTNLEDNYDRLTYKAVLKPTGSSFIARIPFVEEPADFEEIRNFIKKCHLLVSNGIPESQINKPYSPFGWRDTGGLIVMYSNTPDNTIPSIHWSSESWNPIFPRHSRN